ncbi:MAG: hypothetical protein VKK42_18630 [Lyngbya sp.]|nr:hypothetical protein [Lyngbya sp.]
MLDGETLQNEFESEFEDEFEGEFEDEFEGEEFLGNILKGVGGALGLFEGEGEYEYEDECKLPIANAKLMAWALSLIYVSGNNVSCPSN